MLSEVDHVMVIAKQFSRKETRWLVAGVASLAAAIFVAPPAKASDPLRIMAMGDSITAGYTDAGWTEPYQYGYRSELYNLLNTDGYDFQFVGSSTELLDHETISPGTTPPADLHAIGQNAHNGYGGQTASFLNSNILDWITADHPDVILLKIGTNSQDQAGLNTLVNTITTYSPSTHLVIAEIMPKWTYQQGIVDYNTYIRDTLVPTYQGLGKNVTVVDQYANFLTNTADLTSIDQSRISNGINHPDNVGYDRMAQTWFEGIQAIDLTQTSSLQLFPVTLTKVHLSTPQAFAGDVSDSDLLHGITPVASGWNTGNNASPLELTDGIHGGGFNTVSGDKVQGAWSTAVAGDSVIYDLGTGDSGLGFDLTSIVSIADWEGSGLGNQDWTIEVKGIEGEYELLALVTYEPFTSSEAGATKVTLTNDDEGILASGVQFIRVKTNAVNSAGGFVWRELDVYGNSTVPEPSSLVLLSLSGIALVRRRRTCRS